MDYTEVSLAVPLGFTEMLAWHLQELGHQGVVVSELAAEGPRPEEVAVKVYLPGSLGPESTELAKLDADLAEWQANFPELRVSRTLRLVPEEDWAHAWKRFWHAQRIGDRVVIKPSWEDFSPEPGDLVIELDPKQAFGTGTHPTTQLCLRALETALEGHDRPLVFDVGTGSGILAIASVLLGARKVLACDTDPVAVAATDENIALNGVADRVETFVGGIETIEGQADVLVINILAEVVAALAPEISRRVRPGGDVIASGIIRERQALVEEAFAAVGLTTLRVEYQGEWVLLEARKPEDFVLERAD